MGRSHSIDPDDKESSRGFAGVFPLRHPFLFSDAALSQVPTTEHNCGSLPTPSAASMHDKAAQTQPPPPRLDVGVGEDDPSQLQFLSFNSPCHVGMRDQACPFGNGMFDDPHGTRCPWEEPYVALDFL